MKTKLKEMMDWFTALNKDKVQFKITSEHHHALLWAFAVASQRRSRTFVLTNGSFRFFWGTKTEAGFVDVDVTFDNERCFMRLVTKETKTEEVTTSDLKGVEA